MSHSSDEFTQDEFDDKFASKIDFTNAQFVYLHVEVKVRMRKSPNISEMTGNSSRVNLPIYTQSLPVSFTDDITAGRKNKNSAFFQWVDSEKLKNYSAIAQN